MPIAPRTLPFVLLTFLQEAVVLLGTSTAEGLFMKRVGTPFLPGLYLMSAVVSVSSSLVYAIVRSRWDNRRLALATIAGFGLSVLAVEGPLERHVRPAFYVYFAVVAIFVMISRIQLWLVINRRFTTREAKRVFPILTGSGLAGSIAGGLMLQLFPSSWGPQDYERVIAAVVAIYLGVFVWGARGGEEARQAPEEGRSRDWTAVLGGMREAASSPYVRNLAFLMLGHMLVLTVVDYQFNRVSDARFPTEAALIGFFGMFRSVTNMGAFVSQMMLTQRVILALGVGLSLLVTPLAAVGYSAALLVAFGFYTGVVAKLAARFLQRTLFASLYRVLFNAVDERRRDAAMLVCDGVAYSLGTVTASALLWSVVPYGPTAINLTCAAGAIGFLAASLRLRREYLSVLVEHFKTGFAPAKDVLARIPGSAAVEIRKGSLAALARLRTDAIVPYLVQGLTDPHRDVRIEAVRGLAALGNEAVLPELIARLDCETDDRVRSQLVRAFARFKSARSMEASLGFLQDKVPRIRADLLEILGTLDDPRYARLVVPSLEDREVRVRANAVLALWRMGDVGQVRKALEVLKKMMGSRDGSRRAAAAYVLGRIGNRMAARLLSAMLEAEQEPRVLRNVALALTRTGGEALIDPLLVAFSRAGAEARPIWIAALKHVGRSDAAPYVRAALTGESGVRTLAIEMLGYLPLEETLETLLDLSRDPDPEIRISALRSLTRHANPRVDSRLAEVLRTEENERVRATALRRLSGVQARRLFPEMLRGMKGASARERANTIESLTGLVGRMEYANQEKIVELACRYLSDPSGRVAANAAYALWKLDDPRGAAALKAMLDDGRVRSALHIIGKTQDSQFIDSVSKLLGSEDESLRVRAARELERIGARWNQILSSLGSASDRRLAELLSAYTGGDERLQSYLRRALTEGREALAGGLSDPDPEVRLRVLEAMQLLDEGLDRPEALELLELPNERHRMEAARILARAEWKEPPDAFRRFWQVGLDRVYRFVWAAGLLSRVATVGMPSLLAVAEAAAARARATAAALVATFDVFDGGKNLGPISANLQDADPISRARALEALENLVPKELSRHVIGVLETDDRGFGALAEHYFTDPARAPGIDALFGLVRDSDVRLREASGDALVDLAERYLLEVVDGDPAGRPAARARALAEAIERHGPRATALEGPKPREEQAA